MISTETFLRSDGFEMRKETFVCLVDYLEKLNVSDEYFDVADSYSISTTNCESIVDKKNQSFYADLDGRMHCFYPVYNATSRECVNINNPLCSVTGVTKHLAACFNLKTLGAESDDQNFSDDEQLKKFYAEMKTNCDRVSACLDCITQELAATDYEQIRFHATTDNVTVVEFQVWKYFSIAPRVKELVSQGRQLETDALEACVSAKACQNNLNFCE